MITLWNVEWTSELEHAMGPWPGPSRHPVEKAKASGSNHDPNRRIKTRSAELNGIKKNSKPDDPMTEGRGRHAKAGMASTNTTELNSAVLGIS